MFYYKLNNFVFVRQINNYLQIVDKRDDRELIGDYTSYLFVKYLDYKPLGIDCIVNKIQEEWSQTLWFHSSLGIRNTVSQGVYSLFVFLLAFLGALFGSFFLCFDLVVDFCLLLIFRVIHAHAGKLMLDRHDGVREEHARLAAAHDS